MRTRLVLTLFVFSTLLTAHGQGTAFTYQGRLNDGSNPANGVYDLRFAIYDSANTGNLIAGPLTNSATGVTNGLFTITLDFGGIFTGTNYWLDIAVRTNGAGPFLALSLRQPTTPAPYAIFATAAGNLNGGGANLTSLNANSISTGTLSDTRLSTNVALRSGGNTFGGTQIFTGTIALNSTGGFDQSSIGSFLIDAPFNPGGRFAVLANGNIGVGNSSPQYKLDVGGDIGLPLPATIYAAGNPILRVDADGNSFLGDFAGNLTLTGLGNVGAGYGSLYFDTQGSFNTACGYGALNINISGNNNTAIGAYALVSNTNGIDNTAEGYQALYQNISGYNNTANGYQALDANTTGAGNTAAGYQASFANTTGNNNVANGLQALYSNTNGYANTADGYQALYSNLSGHDNTANGFNSLYGNTFGSENVADGEFALLGNTAGNQNTAVGVSALYYNSIGSSDVAVGYQASYFNTVGVDNVASGYQALYSNTNGSYNVASGYQCLYFNASGSANVASGYRALYSNTAGGENTAAGSDALYANTTGDDNTALGHAALEDNTTGTLNTAVGEGASGFNTNGSYNVAVGTDAIGFSANGNYNTAVGYNALEFTSSGSSNVAVGQQAGLSITSGSYNIDIGNPGTSLDAATIRIGVQGTQSSAFIAGISGTPVTGAAVVVNSSGQLGVAASSERFKQNIHAMDDASDVLLALQPVTFQYKPDIDPQGLAQFGLIAEQVEKIDPDLVVHDRQHGIFTVRYEAVNAMLLNEFLKQHKTVVDQNAEIEQLNRRTEDRSQKSEDRIQKLESENAELKQRLTTLERLILPRDETEKNTR